MIGKVTRLNQGQGASSSGDASSPIAPGKRTLTSDLPSVPAYEPRKVEGDRPEYSGDLDLPSAPVYESRKVECLSPPSVVQVQAPRSGLPRLDLVTGKVSAGGSTHAVPPRRVADAKDANKAAKDAKTAKGAEPNAIIKVVAYSKGKILGQPWGAKARWEGPLPQKYTGTRGAAGWTWDSPDAKTVRIGSDLQGKGGQTVEAWAGAHADRIIVYATALDAVTDAEDAAPDEHAPGHATDRRDAGDGSSSSVKPAGRSLGNDGGAQGRDHATQGRDHATQGRDHDAASTPGDTGEHEQAPHSDASHDDDLDPSDADERLVTDFERELDIESLGEDSDYDGAASGLTSGGTSPTQGRTGTDTRIDGTGPGGGSARPDGDGKGSEDGGRGGSAEGSRDGDKGGAPDGMYGGEGKPGDGGIPSAVALFGGLVSVPPALRGLVEIALIASSGDATGAGSQLFKRGLGKLASAAAARTMIAQEARVVAVRETKRTIERLAADKRTAQAWAKATAAEKDQVKRIIYWELQRKYFQGYLTAARRAKSEAKAALKKTPASSNAQQNLKRAELAEEAASAPPVAGQLPRNHEFAGKQFPSDRLPPAFRQKGLRFSEAGYPDFSPHAQTLPNGQKSVQITYTGSRSGDFAAANAKAGYAEIPDYFTWHHHQDMKTMLLVPKDLHDAVQHTGGVATYKHTSGVEKYGK